MLKHRGPLGGIYTGLLHSKDMYNFVVACDMPFINPELIKYMLGKISNYDVVIPEYNNRLQPLCAIYSKSCIRPIEIELSKKNLKVINFLKYVKVKKITEKVVTRLNPEKRCFANINTPRDYQAVKDVDE